MKQKKGLKISSRKLTRTLKQAGILTATRGNSLIEIKDELNAATKTYYELKQKAPQLRETHLNRLASSLAAAGNSTKENIIKQLRLREKQRSTARKIKYLRGRLIRNSTTMVSIRTQDGTTVDIVDKKEME